LVSLCSYLALAINIIGFIFTCIAVISVSLVFIHLSAPVVWLCVLVNGKWVLKLKITGAVGDTTNAGVKIYFSAASRGVIIKAQETKTQEIINQETIIQVIMLQMTISPSVRRSNSGNNNPGDTVNNNPGNTEGNTRGKLIQETTPVLILQQESVGVLSPVSLSIFCKI
jgi:hypothetical protein